MAVLVNGVALLLTDTGQQMVARHDSQMTALTSAQMALDRLSQDLRQARQANIGCSATQLSFDPVGGGQRITYDRDAATGTHTRTQGAASQTSATGISSLTFNCQTPGLIKVQLTASVTTPRGGTGTQVLTSQLQVPNP